MNAKHRFLVDAMLGRLCRWLRVLGWDTEYVEGSLTEDPLARAEAENRILLTRRQGIEDNQLIFVESEILEDQLRQLEVQFKVLSQASPFTRCIECNAGLERVDKPEIKDSVPFFTYQTQTEFYRCPECKKVFWPGSHHQAMLKKVKGLKETSPSP
jgi:uncharacterized protein with PIN domain